MGGRWGSRVRACLSASVGVGVVVVGRGAVDAGRSPASPVPGSQRGAAGLVAGVGYRVCLFAVMGWLGGGGVVGICVGHSCCQCMPRLVRVWVRVGVAANVSFGLDVVV